MTVIAAFIDSEGAGFVSDMRLLGDCSIVSDNFCKLTQLANSTLTLAIAGEVGPAQMWVRAALKSDAKSVEALLDAFLPGDYNFLLYDAVSHALYSGDGTGCLIPVESFAVHGIGEEFLKGYIAAKGMPTARGSKLSRLSAGISECAKVNVAVSRETDMMFVSRAVFPRKKPSRQKYHLAA